MKQKPLKTESINTDSTTDLGSVSIIKHLLWVIAACVAVFLCVFVYVWGEQIKTYSLASIIKYLPVYMAGLGTSPLIGKGLNSIKKFIQK